jgi:hypothetical protein
MTTSDYLINAPFVSLVLRQAYERRLDARSALLPLVIVFVVARQYVHSIPTAGNDLVLISAPLDARSRASHCRPTGARSGWSAAGWPTTSSSSTSPHAGFGSGACCL